MAHRVYRVFPDSISNWLYRDWSYAFAYFMILNEIKEKNHSSLIGDSIVSYGLNIILVEHANESEVCVV